MFFLIAAALISSPDVATLRDTLDVKRITDEADSVVALASRAAKGSALSSTDFHHLSHTIGFAHLQERESHFGGALSDSALREFVNGLANSGQSAAYRAELHELETVDMTDAASKASANLPRGTTLRARLYLEIKPRPNSFVFTGADSLPSIFLSDGRIATADSVTRRGDSYFGVQGPWYTVGWLMASTIERELGRPALIASTCDPVGFLADYNHAVARAGARAQLPSWPKELIARLRVVQRSLEK